MPPLRIAVVSNDSNVRLEAARAFDDAPASWSVSLHTSVPEDADFVVLGPDARGDGIPFDPAEPKRAIDEIKSRVSQGKGAIVVVTSTSGGVGCTSLALHLAAAFASDTRIGFIEFAPGAGLRWRLRPASICRGRTWTGRVNPWSVASFRLRLGSGRCSLPRAAAARE